MHLLEACVSSCPCADRFLCRSVDTTFLAAAASDCCDNLLWNSWSQKIWLESDSRVLQKKKKDIYVRRKVRIGTIPELSCAKWEFSLCPPIPELYRTILQLRKGYMLKIDKVCVPAQRGNSWTKWEFVKSEKCVMRKRFECLIRKTDYSNNIATSFWAK